MTWVTILKAVLVAVCTFITTGLPAIINLVKAIKARKEAVTQAEKEKATNDMLSVVNNLIESAEAIYAETDAVLKEKGGSAGALKKETVLAKLQAYALRSGYDFDEDFWSEKIDEIVAFTRGVNNKVAAVTTEKSE